MTSKIKQNRCLEAAFAILTAEVNAVLLPTAGRGKNKQTNEHHTTAKKSETRNLYNLLVATNSDAIGLITPTVAHARNIFLALIFKLSAMFIKHFPYSCFTSSRNIYIS